MNSIKYKSINKVELIDNWGYWGTKDNIKIGFLSHQTASNIGLVDIKIGDTIELSYNELHFIVNGKNITPVNFV